MALMNTGSGSPCRSRARGQGLLHAEMKGASQLFRAQAQRFSALLDGLSGFGEAAWGNAPESVSL